MDSGCFNIRTCCILPRELQGGGILAQSYKTHSDNQKNTRLRKADRPNETALGRHGASGAINYLFQHLKAPCRFPGDSWAYASGWVHGPESPQDFVGHRDWGKASSHVAPPSKGQHWTDRHLGSLPTREATLSCEESRSASPKLEQSQCELGEWSRPINVTTFAKSCILQHLKCGRYGWLLLNCRMKSISGSRIILQNCCCCKPRSYF